MVIVSIDKWNQKYCNMSKLIFMNALDKNVYRINCTARAWVITNYLWLRSCEIQLAMKLPE